MLSSTFDMDIIHATSGAVYAIICSQKVYKYVERPVPCVSLHSTSLYFQLLPFSPLFPFSIFQPPSLPTSLLPLPPSFLLAEGELSLSSQHSHYKPNWPTQSDTTNRGILSPHSSFSPSGLYENFQDHF